MENYQQKLVASLNTKLDIKIFILIKKSYALILVNNNQMVSTLALRNDEKAHIS